jgi:ribosomal protein L32
MTVFRNTKYVQMTAQKVKKKESCGDSRQKHNISSFRFYETKYRFEIVHENSESPPKKRRFY